MHLADIGSSIFSSLGLVDTQDLLDCGTSPAGRECLFLVDGLGAEVISTYADLLPTLSNFKYFSPVETSFPSTTATSLTTLSTGVMPGVHGMLGYTVRVPRSGGRILNSIKWDERVDPVMWQSVPTLFERAMNQGIAVSHVAAKRYENTGFTQATFRGADYKGANVLSDVVAQTKLALKTAPSFAYVYVNDLDVAGHSDGVGSEKWIAALKYVDHVAHRIISQIPRGTRFWITADHGMINVQEKIVLGQGNPLMHGVALLAGEPRARHIYLDETYLPKPESIVNTWQEFLGERAQVLTQADAISSGLFGATVTLDSRERMGDVIAIARDGLVLIDPEREAMESSMVGHHGAITDAERLIPLGLLETT